MTDVFGNYVIQKLFEHGSQTQKKILANQMKNRVMNLSTQMYGCRVVQKALEHILTDQQASMVKELEAHVLKCVKDQNGNHVIQKAIERVPAEHIQFIIISQLLTFSKHKFASNVVEKSIQCAEASQRAEILRILTTPNDKGESPLLGLMRDQYGNYVIRELKTMQTHGRRN